MLETIPLEVRVRVDIGWYPPCVTRGLSSGEGLEVFNIDHQAEGFEPFFARLRLYEHQYAVRSRWRWKGSMAMPAPWIR